MKKNNNSVRDTYEIDMLMIFLLKAQQCEYRKSCDRIFPLCSRKLMQSDNIQKVSIVKIINPLKL